MMAVFAGEITADEARRGIYPAGNKPIAPLRISRKNSEWVLFVSGQIPYVNGSIPAQANDCDHDIQDQAKIVMGHLQSILNEAGYCFDDAVRATVYLSDIGNYGGFNEVYGTFGADGDMPPSRAAIAVRDIPAGKPGAPVLVEVSTVAYKSE